MTMPPVPLLPEYDRLKNDWQQFDSAARLYGHLHTETIRFASGGGKTPDFFQRLTTATGTDFTNILGEIEELQGVASLAGGEGEGASVILSVLERLQKSQRAQADALLPRLFAASEAETIPGMEPRFAREFGEGTALLISREAPDAAEPFEYKAVGGVLLRLDKTGQTPPIIIGDFSVAPADTVMQRDNGDLVAISSSGRIRVLQEGFGFSQIDPERLFALEAQQTDVAFMGLELTARGQEIQALGQDMANRILLGRMEIEEATFRLNRVNSAFDVRRLERDVALKFAITQTSIRTLPSGERVFRSPLAEATARVLGLPENALDLPVGVVNPEASAQALLDATQLDSPIPDLEAQADATAAATQALLAAPLQGAPGG